MGTEPMLPFSVRALLALLAGMALCCPSRAQVTAPRATGVVPANITTAPVALHGACRMACCLCAAAVPPAGMSPCHVGGAGPSVTWSQRFTSAAIL